MRGALQVFTAADTLLEIEAATGAELTFEVPGRLVELPVDEGQQVKQGQLLARLDPQDYRNQVAQARASYLKAEQDYKRSQELYANRSIALAEFQADKAAFELATEQRAGLAYLRANHLLDLKLLPA